MMPNWICRISFSGIRMSKSSEQPEDGILPKKDGPKCPVCGFPTTIIQPPHVTDAVQFYRDEVCNYTQVEIGFGIAYILNHKNDEILSLQEWQNRNQRNKTRR